MTDALSTIKTVLSDNWTAGNTDSITPTFTLQGDFEYKQFDLKNGDLVKIYEVGENWRPFDIGKNTWERVNIISIECLTTYKNATLSTRRAHLDKMIAEVIRIVKANVSDPDANFKELLPVRKSDRSSDKTGIARMVLDVSLKEWG